MEPERRSLTRVLASVDGPSAQELEAEVRAMLVPDALSIPPALSSSTDTSGAVTVQVDQRGRVTRINIDPGWRELLDAAGLVSALLTTYQQARQRAAQAQAEATLIGVREPEARSPYAREESVHPAPDDPAAWSGWAADMREQIYAERQRAARIRAGDEVLTRTVTGPHRCLTATIVVGEVIALHVDHQRIHEVSSAELARDAYEVFAAARLDDTLGGLP